MELMLIIRVLLRRWWLIAIPTLIAAVITLPALLSGTASSGGYTTAIKYSAAQEFNLPDRDGDYQDVWLASELAVNAFTEWARSRSYRDEMALLLADAEPAVDMTLLGIAADNERSVGIIYMSHPDADALALLADAAITVLQDRSSRYFPQLGGEPAQVTLLDMPEITSAPPPLTNRFAPFIRIGVALFAGLMLALLAEYLDPRLRTSDELERAGLKVLASIPRHRH